MINVKSEVILLNNQTDYKKDLFFSLSYRLHR